MAGLVPAIYDFTTRDPWTKFVDARHFGRP